MYYDYNSIMLLKNISLPSADILFIHLAHLFFIKKFCQTILAKIYALLIHTILNTECLSLNQLKIAIGKF